MDPELSKLIETLGGLGALGLVAWLVRRIFTHTIPRLAGDFKDTLEKQLDHFVEELRTQRSDFRIELASHREDFKAELALLRSEFKSDMERLGDRIDRLTDAFIERRKDSHR